MGNIPPLCFRKMMMQCGKTAQLARSRTLRTNWQLEGRSLRDWNRCTDREFWPLTSLRLVKGHLIMLTKSIMRSRQANSVNVDDPKLKMNREQWNTMWRNLIILLILIDMLFLCNSIKIKLYMWTLAKSRISFK